MAQVCNKCQQSPPHLGDSWCLACSALEALGAELRQSWGNPGSRAVAQDLLVSAVRQTRALRRLSLSGAGGGRASSTGSAGGNRADLPKAFKSLPRPPSPPRRSLGEESVKKEAEATEESETGSEETNKTKLPEEEKSGEEEPDSSRKRHNATGKGGASEEPRGKERAERPRSRDRPRSRTILRSRERSKGEPEKEERRRRNPRPGHRAGTKHKRHYRAEANPFKPLHYQKPDSFWDQAPFGS